MQVDDLLGALWLPGDGKVNPTDLTQSLAKGARQRRRDGRASGCGSPASTLDGRRGSPACETDQGDVEAEVVVNCAGQWAKALGRPGRRDRAAALVPSTSTSSPRRSRAPTRTCRSCATRTAGRTSRRRSAAWSSAGSSPRPSRGGRRTTCRTPSSSSCSRRTGSTSRCSWTRRCTGSRCWPRPASASSTTARSRSPRTTSSCSGGRPSCDNFFVGAGFNSVGIASAGGAGRALAEWIVAGEPTGRPGRRRRTPVRAVPRRQRAGCATGSPRCSGCTTPCRGRTASSRPRATSGSSPAARAAGRGRGGLRLQDGLGASERLRAGARRRPRLLLGQAVLAALVGGRAAGDPRRRSRSSTRRRSRSTSSPGPARSGGAAVGLRGRRRRAGRAAASTRRGSTQRGTYEADLTVTRDGPDAFWVVSSARPPRCATSTGCAATAASRRGDVTDAFAVLGRDGPGLARPAGPDLVGRLVGGRLPVRHQPEVTVAGVARCGPPG